MCNTYPVVGTLVAIYLLGGSVFPKPDLEAWLGKSEKALHSPPLFQVLRR